MLQAHLAALQKKHEKVEKMLHEERIHLSSSDDAIRRLKEERFHLKEEIERLHAE